MLYSGKFLHNDIIYTVHSIQTDNGKRVDISLEEIDPFSSPLPTSIAVSYVEDLINSKRYYFGDLDLYYAFERVKREASIYPYLPEETVDDNILEEGSFRYIAKHTSKDSEFHFDSLFFIKQNYYYRVRDEAISLSLKSESFSNIARHIMIEYNMIETRKSGFDEDGLITSRIATLNELREKYDLSWMNNKDYRWMHSFEELREHLNMLHEHVKQVGNKALCAFDTETTGLNMYNLPKESGMKDKLVSIVMTWKVNFAIYIPIRHKYEKNLDEKKVLKMLKAYLKQVPLLTQYGIYDLKTLIEFELDGENIPFRANIQEDLLIENYIIDPNPNRSSRGLKDQVQLRLNIKQLSLSDLFPPTADGSKAEIKFELLGKQLALFYACPDVDLLLECHLIVRPQVPSLSEAIYKVEIDFMPIAAEAEYYGLKIDMKQFHYEKRLCEQLAQYLENVIYQMAGYKFNINSSDQVSDLLYNKLGCEKLVVSKTNPNKGSTSSKALKSLAKVKNDTGEVHAKSPLIQYFKNNKGEEDQRIILEVESLNESKYPIILVLQKYRDVVKLLTGFFNSIEQSNKGGTLYSWVNQTGAQTGRIISPLQTLPPYIKQMIIPDTSEHGWIVMDFKQVELRLMFGISKEHEMIAQAEDPDKDIHRIIAAGIYKIPIWAVFKKIRNLAKGLNFGIPYQLGILNLALTLYGFTNKKEELEKRKADATQDRANYFKLMPRVERMFQDTKYLIAKYGMIYTYLGRRYVYPTIFTETDKGKISKMLRQGGNARIQGLGADTFKLGCVRLDRDIRAKEWNRLVEVHNADTGLPEGKFPLVRQSFFVHDELGVNYHKKTINPLQVLYLLQKNMEVELDGFPPLYIGPAVVKTWAEAKKDKYEIPTELLYRWCKEVEQGMHTEPLENPEEWVFAEIEKFHEQNYRKYFKELEAELVAEGKEVTEDNIKQIFRHDVLSHHVMSTFDDKQFEKEQGHLPEDVEWLEWAVVKFIRTYNILGANEKEKKMEEVTMSFNPFASISETLLQGEMDFSMEVDSDEDSMMEDLSQELDVFSKPIDVIDNFNFEADTSAEDYTSSFYTLNGEELDVDEYVKLQEELKTSMSSKVLTLYRTHYIDVNGATKDAVAKVLTHVKENHLDDGLYDVSISSGQEIIETEFKVDKLDLALIELILKERVVQ